MPDPNEVLRRARERPPSSVARGESASRQELADLVNAWIFDRSRRVTCLTANYLGKLERGQVRWPQADYRAALRAILGSETDAELGFYRPRRRHDISDQYHLRSHRAGVVSTVPGTSALPPPQTVPSPESGDLLDLDTPVRFSRTWKAAKLTMDRRSLLSKLAGLSTAVWLGHSGGFPIDVSAMPKDGGMDDVLANMRQLRSLLAYQDNMLGASSVMMTAAQQVAVLASLGRTCTGAARASVVTLQAAYAEFAGWLADDLGDRAAGQQWLNSALLWAHEADDELMLAYVLMRQAQRAVEAAESSAAIAAACASQRRGDTTHRVRAAAAQAEACGHAMSGEESAFATAISLATELAQQAPALIPGERASWCTPAFIAAHDARGWAQLGRHEQAVNAYRRALTGLGSTFQRDRGLYLGRVARSHAALGDMCQALNSAQAALAVARDTRSARVLTELAPLPQVLAISGAGPELSEFTHDLAKAQNGTPSA